MTAALSNDLRLRVVMAIVGGLSSATASSPCRALRRAGPSTNLPSSQSVCTSGAWWVFCPALTREQPPYLTVIAAALGDQAKVGGTIIRPKWNR